MMRLVYLVPNSAWVFLFGESILTIEGFPKFFTTRSEAVDAARFRGLKVTRNGEVQNAEG